jgi:hypothetical protein
MPNYSVEGKLGTGKGLFCVWMAKEAALDGRRIAGNMDIYPEKLTPGKVTRYTRLPDKPTAADFEALGHGNPENRYDESRNGVLLLDELGTWLNARAFQDKSRAPVIDWMIHARKHGWDMFLQVQNSGMIDKQVREALIEFQCICRRMDKIKIPIIGGLLALIHRRLSYLPRWHRVIARMAVDGVGQSIVAEKWNFRGRELFEAYDTLQVFRTDYEHGAHSVLPPWDWKPRKGIVQALRETLARRRAAVVAERSSRLKPKLALVQKIALADPDRALAHVARLTRRGLLSA